MLLPKGAPTFSQRGRCERDYYRLGTAAAFVDPTTTFRFPLPPRPSPSAARHHARCSSAHIHDMPASRSSRQPLQAQHAPNYADAEVIVLSSDDDDHPLPRRKAPVSKRTSRQRGKTRARHSPAVDPEVLEISSEEDNAARRNNTSAKTTIASLQRKLEQLQQVSIVLCVVLEATTDNQFRKTSCSRQKAPRERPAPHQHLFNIPLVCSMNDDFWLVADSSRILQRS